MKTYLDFASTTPMASEVIEKMHAVMSEGSFGNPSSLDHEYGIRQKILLSNREMTLPA